MEKALGIPRVVGSAQAMVFQLCVQVRMESVFRVWRTSAVL